MTYHKNNQEDQFTKEYTKMGVSAIAPLTLAILGEVLSQKTKIGGNILFTMSAIAGLYTAKVFYSVYKKNKNR